MPSTNQDGVWMQLIYKGEGEVTVSIFGDGYRCWRDLEGETVNFEPPAPPGAGCDAR